MRKRYFFLGLLALIAGILIFSYAPFYVASAIILAVVGTVFLFFKRLRFTSFLILLCVTGILISSLSYKEYNLIHKNTDIVGTVTSFELTEQGYNIYIADCDFSETPEKENVTALVLYDSEDLPFPLKEGYRILFKGNAYPAMFGKNANPLLNDRRLSALSDSSIYTVYSTDITVLEANTDLNYSLRTMKDSLRRVIFSNIHHGSSASVLYAMFTGDRAYLSPETKDIFLSCGTSHLLAVSGLHVSIILSLLVSILKKLRVSSVATVIIIFAFVTLYTVFTGFSSSIIRASIMALTLSISFTVSERYDPLNALGLSGILILLLNPYSLFDVGFQLSFVSCFGILVFTKCTVSTKYKLLNTFANAGLLTCGATIFTLPLQIFYFGEISLVSLIANMLFVPIMSLVLIVLVMLLPIALLIPVTAGLLKIPGYATEIILKISEFLGKAPSLTIINTAGFSVVAIIGLSIFATRFIRIKPIFKRKIYAGILLLITLSTIINSVYTYNNVFVSVPYGDDRSDTVHIQGKETHVVGLSTADFKYLTHNAYEIDCLFILSEAQMQAYDSLENIKVKSIYVLPQVDLSKKARLNGARHMKDTVIRSDGSFTAFEDGIVFEHNGATLYVGAGETTRKFTVAVTKSTVTRGETVITNGLLNENCDKLFDIRINGYTRVPLRSHNEPY